MGHVHEPESDRRFARLAIAGFSPAHDIQERKSERSSDAFQARAAIHQVVTFHGRRKRWILGPFGA